MLQENVSKNLGVNFIVLQKNKQKLFLCSNGVAFTKEEYLAKYNTRNKLYAEWQRRNKEGELYDYVYAKNTGYLRKQKGAFKTEENPEVKKENASNTEVKKEVTTVLKVNKTPKSIAILCLALSFVSLGSAYISTVHTATYLMDYVDCVSAWIMSAVVTIYCSTAFEVIVLFFENKRKALSSIFALLWLLVVIFSMSTTVSVFYDRYNFKSIENQSENVAVDSARLELEILTKKEQDIRYSIKLKEDDINYRREHDYATTAVRQELNKLQDLLNSCLQEQQTILANSPTASKKENEIHKKESLFSYLGRLLHLDGGIIEFIMSTLSAVFINLISPFSVTCVISLLNKKE